MATRTYQLRQADHSESLARRHVPQGTEIQHGGCDWIPHVKCPKCHMSLPGGDHDLPESVDLPEDHPIRKRLRSIDRRRRKESKGDLFMPPVSWEEYQSVTAEIREALSLPAGRVLPACTTVGRERFDVVALPTADVTLVPSDDVVVTPRFVAWLESSKITGWATEQVELRFKKKPTAEPPELLRLRITGRAGLPARIEGPTICPLCGGRLYFYRRRPVKHLVLNERAWDGSDFFRFEGFEYEIHVTQTVKEAMEEAGFTTVRFVEQVLDPSDGA